MLASQNKKVSLILIGLGSVFLFMSYKLPKYTLVPVDADAVPIFLGYLLIFLSIILFFTKDQETEVEDGEEQVTKPKKGLDKNTKMLLVFGGIVLFYIVLLEILGFLITTAIFIFITTLLLGYKKHKTNIIVALAVPVGFYYLFNFVLKISLPKGILPF
ncbi:tripartite tricarboxylate transporter TctB family protein [Sporosarcina sp. 6E9]|uniref:tripartite tricarboxylate transporter TctB family protein n=1 Tax=Sporosarcina sp. 6E9 TaxID=2819235 RepID=UPI001B300DF4|nr:tripartite tricarboxylate transporter TctB family protein [Sporosarcina sp. 6E9]